MNGLSQSGYGLLTGFLGALRSHPSSPALEVDGTHLSYEELARHAAAIASQLTSGEAPSLVAVYGNRSLPAYAGVLAALMAGAGYVPLHPDFPAARSRAMLQRSGATAVIVGQEAIAGLAALLEVETPLAVVMPASESTEELAKRYPRHRFTSASTLEPADPAPRRVADDDLAYLLFTSGSTGSPKGVPIRHGNVLPYVEYVSKRYSIGPRDRASQTFDLTFDLSVHDLFVTWSGAACLVSVPERTLLGPAKFIRDSELTLWFSVPSVAMSMASLRMLKTGAFPALRASLFCGEPLPMQTASAWARAAPNSVVDNLYGPTEATIATTAFRWDEATSPEKCLNGLVPIGSSFAHQRAAVVTEGRLAARGAPGELWLAGPQVCSGYWQDEEKTAAQFVSLTEDPGTRWYRSGDLAHEDEERCLYFRGRLDTQVKVLGHRIELQEIEGALRRAADCEFVVALPWPVRDGLAQGIVAFLGGSAPSGDEEILAASALELAPYMVPSRLIRLPELPLNPNGKVDRRALLARMEEGAVP